jgi:hypothetical protein
MPPGDHVGAVGVGPQLSIAQASDVLQRPPGEVYAAWAASPAGATAAVHASAADTRPPRPAVCAATSPQIRPGRLPVIRPASGRDPAARSGFAALEIDGREARPSHRRRQCPAAARSPRSSPLGLLSRAGSLSRARS